MLFQAVSVSRQDVMFGLATALTAWVAFALASLQHIQNAFWAPMAVWIVAQSTRGMVLERGAYRIFGTIAGALVGMIALYSGLPAIIVIFLVSLWAGICASLTHLLRASFTYVPLMAGLTASIVVMPSINAVGAAYALPVSRVVCTIIGVVCVVIFSLILLPSSPRRVFLDQVRSIAGEALLLAAIALEKRDTDKLPKGVHVILERLASAEQQASVVNAGSMKRSRRIRLVNAFIAATIGVLAASRAATVRLGEQHNLPETDIGKLVWSLTHASKELKSPAGEGEATAIGTLDIAVAQAHRIDERLALSLKALLAAESAVTALIDDRGTRRLFLEAARLQPKRDWRSALLAIAGGSGATFLAGLLVIYSGWSQAWLASLGICTFAMLLATMDYPRLAAPKMMQGVIVGAVFAAFFRYFVLPWADSLLEILVLISPFMVLGGVALATNFRIQAVDANMCFFLGSQPFFGVATDLQSILAASGSLIVSVLVVGSSYLLLSRRPKNRARYVSRLLINDIERLSETGGGGLVIKPWHEKMSRRLLRLMLHVGRAGDIRAIDFNGVLGIVNLAHAIVDMKAVAQTAYLDEKERALLMSLISSFGKLSVQPGDARSLLAHPGNTTNPELTVLFKQAQVALDDSHRLIKMAS